MDLSRGTADLPGWATAYTADQLKRLLDAYRSVDENQLWENLAYFLERVPGAYFLLGARPPGDVDVYPHHSPKFDFDEACIPLGIELGLRIVERATASQLD